MRIMQLAGVATVNRCGPRQVNRDPNLKSDCRNRAPITRSADEHQLLANQASARGGGEFDAALQSHLDALIAEYKRDHDNSDGVSDQRPPLPRQC